MGLIVRVMFQRLAKIGRATSRAVLIPIVRATSDVEHRMIFVYYKHDKIIQAFYRDILGHNFQCKHRSFLSKHSPARLLSNIFVLCQHFRLPFRYF